MNAAATRQSDQQPDAVTGHDDREHSRLIRLNKGMTRLVSAVQELSLARDLNAIMFVARRAARELTGADGATFVLRDNDHCYYAEEDAIGPLWKGQRFPMNTCISGWAMLHGQPAVIENIYADPRIPADAYRPTFVKSLAIIPIRPEEPIGAIGNYWAAQHMPTKEEVELLQALANTTAVAMENVRVYSELERRVRKRTEQLRAANEELEAFNYAASHDLGGPLRRIRGFCELIRGECAEKLNATAQTHFEVICSEAKRMNQLVADLLRLSRVTKEELTRSRVDLTRMARDIIARLSSDNPGRDVEVQIAPGLEAEGDPGLIMVLLENLLSNAWKYTSKTERARIEFGAQTGSDGRQIFFIRDNGAGFDSKTATDLFSPFRRFHNEAEFPGSGVGLATVRRIVNRHEGQVWAEAAPGQGAAFYFTLGG